MHHAVLAVYLTLNAVLFVIYIASRTFGHLVQQESRMPRVSGLIGRLQIVVDCKDSCYCFSIAVIALAVNQNVD